ncbi:hypothetical protein BDW74DRAFT_172288 [Aspergillus multicolor]|uniref:NACHT and WD repeat domain-containing protein n=1 Tax=Aspergillus multicolor TaxID=41759 RepID=UPI003CCCC8AD
METAASAIAVIQISTAIISACNKYLRDVRHAAEDIQKLKDGIGACFQIVQKLRELAEKTKDDDLEALRAPRSLIENSEVALRELETRLKGKSSNPMRRIGLRALKWPFAKDEVDEVLQRVSERKSTLSMALLLDNFSQSLATTQSINRIEQIRYLEKLPRAVDAAFDSRSQEHEAQCLPGTRTEALQKLVAWSVNSTSETICWLRGMAGTGKSTIARTVASQLHDKGCLGGSFFFSRGAGDRGHAGRMITTLSFQLARKDPELEQNICEAIMEDEDISQRSLAEQCRRLIVGPAKKLAGDTASPLVFVIDALDECDREEDVEMIPQLLTMLASVKSKFRLQVLITGRPERAVRRDFLQLQSHFHHEFDLFGMDDAVVEQDISLLIEDELNKIRSRHGLPHSWPSSQNEVIETLSMKAGSLFIYAKTVCRFIYESPLPQRALRILVDESSSDHSHSSTAALDQMYLTILKHSYIEDELLFKKVIGSIILLRAQFSTAALSGLLAIDKSVITSVLHNLHSVFHVPRNNDESIYLLHPSFRDFLMNLNRCSEMSFQLQADDLHRFLAHNCMRNMQQCLTADVCRLQFPGYSIIDKDDARIAKYIRLETSYACRNWVYHLCQAGGTSQTVVRNFFQTRFHQWVEALVIIGYVYLGIHMILALRSLQTFIIGSSLGEELYHMYRYLMQHRSLIEVAPLQVYHSTPWFNPQESFVSQGIPRLLQSAIVQSGPILSSWSPCEQTWVCFGGLVVSPSADVVACEATQPGTTEIREIITGRCISILDGDGPPLSMAFSKDGSLLLVSALETSRIWGLRFGVCMHILEMGDSQGGGHATFDEDGKAVLIACRSGSITIWDTLNGNCRHTLEGHTEAIWHDEFSPDTKHIVSSSLDTTVRLWDTINGNLTHTFHGHAGPVRKCCFLKGDRKIVSQSDDQTIRVWDTVIGTCLHILGSSTGYMELSSERDIFAYAAEGSLIRLWNPVAAAEQVDESSFLTRTISSPEYGTLRKERLNILNDVSDRSDVGFLTPDGDRVYHSTRQKTSIYELRNISNDEYGFSHNSLVCDVKYARHCNLMASMNHRGNLAIWNTVSGVCLQKLASTLGEAASLAISSDGKSIACFTFHSRPQILDTETGRWVRTIQCTKGAISGLGFSPDGSLLAYLLHSSVHVLALGTAEHVLKAAIIDSACALDFSPDNEMLAVLGPHGIA